MSFEEFKYVEEQREKGLTGFDDYIEYAEVAEARTTMNELQQQLSSEFVQRLVV